jgi:hypothetical protein
MAPQTVGIDISKATLAGACSQANERKTLQPPGGKLSLMRQHRIVVGWRALSREPNLARAKIGSPNSGSGCGSSSPRLESFFSEDAERAAGCEMALDVESVLDDGVNGQEALS